jgi:8-oxo-dGTP pyrophosphatase MutT (NUDIX family)
MERAFARTCGIRRFSVHINGFDAQDVENKYWVGKRSATKSRFPSMLDNIVAGGLSADIFPSPLECAIKECMEEASIPEPIAREKLIPVGCVTRVCEEENFLHVEDIFIFDFPSPPIPKPHDGEVESFQLMARNDILKRAPEFKPDVLIVLGDFMLRKGLLKSEDFDSPASYAKLCRMIHRPLPLITIDGTGTAKI